MKIAFLGTNGWYSTKTGNTVCVFIETKDYFIVFDAGDGLYKLDRYVGNRNEKPLYLFITHAHLDHIIGLHTLAKFKVHQGIRIYGPVGIKETLNAIVNIPFTVPFAKLPFEVAIHELSEGNHEIPFPVACRTLFHPVPCFGYRLELDGKTIVYCTDTGMCENAIQLARTADLLITECSFKSDKGDGAWPHLNPEEAAQIAKEANVQQLALLHFDASLYTTMAERERAR